MKRYFFLVIVSFILALNIAGCAPMTKLEQSAVFETLLLENKGSVGQTFVAHYDGLQGVEIYLEPHEPGGGTITLQLNTGPMESQELAAGSISLDSISSPGFHQITFTPQKHSTQEYYYLVLEIHGSGSVKVGTAPGNTYINGALYRDHEPRDSQLSFNLMYQPAMLGLGLVKEGLTWIGYLLVAGFLFIIPGWALLSYLYPRWGEKDWASKVALSAGVSLALYPLLLLWTDVVGLHLGAIYAWAPPLLGIIAIFWRNRTALNLDMFRVFKKPRLHWPDVTLILILGMIFAVRFWVIRTLEAPMGGDSVHHSMITHLLVDNKGLFENWEPYANLDSFTYHFGFNAHAAVFHWMTNIPIRFSVLWVGQILNGLAVLALYPLAKKIEKNNKWAGVGAVFLAGLISPMPMFYVNWGKYSQLTAQIILPIGIFFTWKFYQNYENNIRILILSSLIIAGLALTHYRILTIFLLLFPVLFIVEFRRHNFVSSIYKVILIGLSAGILFLPWFIRLFSGNIMAFVNYQLTTPSQEVPEVIKQFSSRGDLFSYLPTWMWILIPITIIWGIWNRNKGILLITTWSLLILYAANPSWLNLPGEGVLTNNAMAVAAYIPASVLLGSGFISLVMRLNNTIHPSLKMILPMFLIPLLGAGLMGMNDRKEDINIQQQILVTRPDIHAATWINENLPEDAKFLVNTFLGFGMDWLLGSDSGWWLPILTHRSTNAPPMLYTTEKPNPYYSRQLVEITRDITENNGINNETMQQVDNLKFNYIYIGQLQGHQFNGGRSFIVVDQLLANSRIKKNYNFDRVWVLEIVDKGK
jgi:hypothetical protein